MAKRMIKAAELAKLQEDGAEVLREEKTVSVPDVVEQLKAIATANEAIGKKRNTEVVDAIDRLSTAIEGMSGNTTIETQDLRPLLSEIVAIQKELLSEKSRPSYEFEVERNSRNLMTRIIARQVERTH